ncbi:MAG TPA: hypothetical protein P5080_05960 [Candidatus Paceibacterota bacterium]|nr:hypothetical protein [Candidatus Pacearchaeota archaeon]HRZ51486.1 hypothetical protein [Candidatus Paceibacterota bacterium]HSA37212.1 hypothetical protein [Candidatus Paceibacterota bacterium]
MDTSILDDIIDETDLIPEDPKIYDKIVPLVGIPRVPWHDHDLDII